MGDMFGQINNLIDSSLGGMFDQLNNIQGGGIALPSETFSKAIKFANILTNVLDCDKANCPPEPTSYSSKGGVSKSIEDSFENIIDKVGLNQKLTPLLDKIDDAIEASPSAPDCSTNVLKCGPPRVDFVGSSGQGASGSAIVNALGQIIGVSINGPGFGFEEPPLLSFFDSCDKGYGAGGYPVMGNVSPSVDENGNKILDNQGNPIYVPDPNGTELGVVDVVITDSGQEYLPNTTETTLNPDGTLTQKEVSPDPNGNYDGKQSYITSLGDVVVDNVGFEYSEGDTATVATDDTIGEAQVELNIQNGFIVGATVVNGGSGFTSLPDITINSDTGAGAKLKPVLKFTKVEDAVSSADTDVPFDRNLPQTTVITVIDCIEK